MPRKSKPTSMRTVLSVIERLPKRLQKIAERQMEKTKKPRNGSRCYARHNPNGLDKEERGNAVRMRAEGATLRVIEVIYDMKPCNGNDAYRVIGDELQHNDELRAEVAGFAKAHGISLPGMNGKG